MNLYQDVFFRFMDFLRGRHTISRLHSLRKSQYWDKNTLEQWQLERLNELLIQAKENSPYFKDALSDIKIPLSSLTEITKLPILSKELIRSNFDSIPCANIPKKRFVHHMTGGSTGEPMHFYWDTRGQDWNRGTVYRSAEWANTALGEKTVQMSGSHYDYNEMQNIKNKIVFFLQRYKDCPVSFLNDEMLEKHFQQIVNYKPASIWGYASGLSILAEYIDKKHPDADLSFIKALMPSSETLREEQRKLLNKVFGQHKVFDQYGSRECYIAAECSAHDGYHIHAEVLIVEIIDKDGNPQKNDELGRVIITDLSNHAFPFIRYEIGDIASYTEYEDCSCGVKLPKIKSVGGRIADLIILSDRVLTPPNFTILLSDKKGIKAFQIKQEKIDSIEILLEVTDEYTDAVLEYIEGALRTLCGALVEITVTVVGEIEIPKSGKRRFVISSISQNYI